MRPTLHFCKTLLLAALCAGPLMVAAQRPPGIVADVAIQLLAVNDFHGHLEPPSGDNGLLHGAPAGGAEYLATYLKTAAALNPNTIIVGAGDLVGASPLISAAFHDEPAIESLNAIGLDVTSVGNHEFDRGIGELLRLQRGGCHPRGGCRDGERFGGARFQYLAANVVDTATRATLLPPTTTRTVGGVTIGFIGETLRRTGRLAVPSAVAGLSFLDEAATANRYAAALERRGVHAIVLLIHEGGRQRSDDVDADLNGCDGLSGGIVPIVSRLSPGIKVVISAHTHRYYNCTIDGHTVTSAGSYGRMFTTLDLTVDRESGRIAAVHAANQMVGRNVEKDPAQVQIITKYAALERPIGERIVGSITEGLMRTKNEAGESALGDVIADSLLSAARARMSGGAKAAFTSPGGIRADLGSRGAGGSVRYGELFSILPFNNVVTTVTMTGDQIRRLLEQQFDNPRPGETTILQVSQGFTYRYRAQPASVRHVDPASVKIDGRVIAPRDRVRVATTNFLADGGDNFGAFRSGVNRRNGGLDLDALVTYVGTHAPLAPPAETRIVRAD